MAGESSQDKPLPPTERRRERARKSGDIAISHDLVAATMLAVGGMALVLMGKAWVGGLTVYARLAFASATVAQTSGRPSEAALLAAAAALAWPLALIFVAGLAVGLGQSRGWVLPAGGEEGSSWGPSHRLPWRDRLADAMADFLKLAVLTAVAAVAFVPVVPAVAVLPRVTAAQAMAGLLALGERIGSRLVIAVVALGVLDYLWRRARHRQRLRMTYAEARREHRETEGDPEQKMERQRLHRELYAPAAPADARNASLLLVDPGRAAAAVAWVTSSAEPPLLIVRGEGPRGRAIESAARGAGVPSCLDPALVRGLAGVKEGSALPALLYGALARAQARAGGGRSPSTRTASPDGGMAGPWPGRARR